MEDEKVEEVIRVQRCLRFERCWFNIEGVIDRDTKLQDAEMAAITKLQ